MHGLATVEGYQGDLDGSIELVDEAETMARTNGFLLGIMHCLDLRALLAMQAADWQRARSLAGQMLSMAAEAGNDYEVGRAEVLLGRAATEFGDLTDAEQLLGTAYTRLRRTGARPAILDALVSMARLFAAIAKDGGSAHFTGSSHRRRELNVELLSLITGDPAVWFETRARADDLIARLAEHLPRSAFDAARAGLRTPEVILDPARDTLPTT